MNVSFSVEGNSKSIGNVFNTEERVSQKAQNQQKQREAITV
jgi:hypothetical protein